MTLPTLNFAISFLDQAARTITPESLMQGVGPMGTSWLAAVGALAVAIIVGGAAGVLIQRAIYAARGKKGEPRWPQDWPRTKDLFTRNPGDATKPGYVSMSPKQALGSGAMPLGRTYPRLSFIPDIFPLRNLRRKVQYWFSKPVFVPYKKRFQHFAVLGKTGGGKSTAFVYPTLSYGALEPNTAYFAIDVKSPEFANVFGDLYRKAGKDVVFFDPWSPKQTLGFEPLWRAGDESKDIIAEVISTYSTEETQTSSSDNSEFFKQAAIRLMRGLLDLAQFWPRRYCNLPSIQQLVGIGGETIKDAFQAVEEVMPDEEDVVAAAHVLRETSEEDLRASPRPETIDAALDVMDRAGYRAAFALKKMRRYERAAAEGREGAEDIETLREAFEGTIRHICREREIQVTELLRRMGEFMSQPEDTRNSVVSTLTNKVAWFRDPMIARAFSRDELDVRTLTQRPCLFLVGAPMAKLRVGSLFVASILSNLAINAVFQRGMAMEKKDKNVSEHGIFFLLDEFPQLNIKSGPQVLATFRGFKAGLAMIYQERSQLKMLYGDNATTMEGNTAHRILLQGAHEETARFYAENAIGEAKITKESKSGAKGEKKSISESTEKMPLMSTTDVRDMRLNGRIRDGLALSVGSDVPAFPMMPVPYYTDPTLRRLLSLDRQLIKKGHDGRETWKFWQWQEFWTPKRSADPTYPDRPEEVGFGDEDPYDQYVDYLLGGRRDRPPLHAPRLSLDAIGLGGGAAGGAPTPATRNQKSSSTPSEAEATEVVPGYGSDFREMLNGDFRDASEPAEGSPPVGGTIAERIEAHTNER